MGGGKLEVIGGNVPAPKEAVTFIQQDEMVDAFGALLLRPLQSCCSSACRSPAPAGFLLCLPTRSCCLGSFSYAQTCSSFAGRVLL